MLLITHDLGIVAKMAQHVAVMYAGQIVEYAPTPQLFREPCHPYTRGLFASLPSRQRRGIDLVTLEGALPQATHWPPACRFEPRCPYHWEICMQMPPRMLAQTPGRTVRCHLYDPTIVERPGLDALQHRSQEIEQTVRQKPEAETRA